MSSENKQTAQGSATANPVHQIVVFKLGNQEYGLHIDQIKEVVITPPVTRTPQTPPYVKGVANIRGNVIAIIDLEVKFGLSDGENRNGRESNFTLVIESEEYKAGILVREVPNTLSVPSANIEDSIFTSEQGEQSYITSIVKLDKRLIIMIDVMKVLTTQDGHQHFRNSTQIVGA
jgi:purine-binding chemotaxis protein CheW